MAKYKKFSSEKEASDYLHFVEWNTLDNIKNALTISFLSQLENAKAKKVEKQLLNQFNRDVVGLSRSITSTSTNIVSTIIDLTKVEILSQLLENSSKVQKEYLERMKRTPKDKKINSLEEASALLSEVQWALIDNIKEALTVVFLSRLDKAKDKELLLRQYKLDLSVMWSSATKHYTNPIATIIHMATIEILSQIVYDLDSFIEMRSLG